MRRKYYLRRRSSAGNYQVILTDQLTGRQTCKTTETSDEKRAHAIAQEWLASGLPEKPKASNVSKTTAFCDYLIQFWDFENSAYFRELETMGREPHREHAFEMQKIVNRYYRPYFKSKLLCQTDEDSLQKFLVYLKIEKKLSASTVNLTRNASIKALRYAKQKHIIQKFDFDVVFRAGGKTAKRGILEREEVDQLFDLEWSNSRSRMAAFIAYNTGMRLSEIRALRICDIHPEKISVTSSWGSISKRKCTKNQEIRDVPILPDLYKKIMDYIKQMGFSNLDGLLLPGNKPEIPLDSGKIRKDFKKMLVKIGIDENIRKERNIVFHSWRHLLAKNLIENGTNKAIAMKIMGQKTSQIFDHYADHVDKETFKQMKKAMENIAQNEPEKEPIPFKVVG